MRTITSAIRFNIIKIATLALICLLALPVFLTGCRVESADDTQIIKTAVEDALSGYKDFNSETLTEFATEMDLDKLDQFGITGQDFLKKYFNGFDFNIEGIDIKDTQATVTANVACRDFASIEDSIASANSDLTTRAQAGKLTASAMKEAYGDVILDAIEQAPLKTFTLSLTYSKIDDSIWILEDNIGIALAGALLGD